MKVLDPQLDEQLSAKYWQDWLQRFVDYSIQRVDPDEVRIRLERLNVEELEQLLTKLFSIISVQQAYWSQLGENSTNIQYIIHTILVQKPTSNLGKMVFLNYQELELFTKSSGYRSSNCKLIYNKQYESVFVDCLKHNFTNTELKRLYLKHIHQGSWGKSAEQQNATGFLNLLLKVFSLEEIALLWDQRKDNLFHCEMKTWINYWSQDKEQLKCIALSLLPNGKDGTNSHRLNALKAYAKLTIKQDCLNEWFEWCETYWSHQQFTNNMRLFVLKVSGTQRERFLSLALKPGQEKILKEKLEEKQ